MTDLLNYRSNIYSQNGEDGIISEILKRLNLDQKKLWCVEFGAWDGMHLSNTFALFIISYAPTDVALAL